VTQMALFEGRRMLRSFPAVFFALAFPVMLLLLFGGIYGNEPRAFFDGRGTIDVSVPAYACLVIAVTGVMSFPLGLAEYRERRILKRLRATPVSPARMLAAQMSVNVALTAAGLALLIVVGAVVFGLQRAAHPALAVAAVALAVLAIYGLGLLLAAVASSERAALLYANLLYFPMIFLSGATIPVETFPAALQDAALLLPLTHAVTVVKAAWLAGESFPAASVVYLLLCAALTVAIAVRTFRWE
jgi:ABC-2 type transport system permease protein